MNIKKFPPVFLLHCVHVYCVASVASNSVQPYELQAPAGLLCPWDSPGQEYWCGLPYPPPGSNLRLLHLPALAGVFFTTSTT